MTHWIIARKKKNQTKTTKTHKVTQSDAITWLSLASNFAHFHTHVITDCVWWNCRRPYARSIYCSYLYFVCLWPSHFIPSRFVSINIFYCCYNTPHLLEAARLKNHWHGAFSAEKSTLPWRRITFLRTRFTELNILFAMFGQFLLRLLCYTFFFLQT